MTTARSRGASNAVEDAPKHPASFATPTSTLQQACSASTLPPPSVDSLVTEIRRIGLARFVSRVNAGVVSPDLGYMAIHTYLNSERERPLVSRLTHLLVGRQDTFEVK